MSTININLPSSTIKDINGIVHYLYTLAQALNEQINSLDAENMSAAYNSKLSTLTSASTKAAELAALLNDGSLAQTHTVRELYEEVKASIVSSAENVTAAYESMITQTQSAIEQYVQANYLTVAEGASLEEQITSIITQTADAIRLEFNTLAEINADSINALALQFGTYFRFSETGLEIGKIGDGASPVVTRITNERIEWIIAGTETVLFYIDGATGVAHLNIAEVGTLSIGDDASGYMDIDMSAIDGLSFRWRLTE
jgi:hypothetical protein